MSSASSTERAELLRRFKPYPAYKDSGAEWLGSIPAHWEIQRLKTFAAVRLSNVDKKSLEGQQPVRLCNYTDVYYNERITADLDFMAATATPEQVRWFSLHVGDVLITKDSESWTDIAVAAVVTEDLPGVLCGYHLAQIRPAPTCYGPFLARGFNAIGPRDQFQVAANGITRFGLGGDAIQTGMFAVPPEPEQRAIASFLDRETARIDALMAKNERLIALLQEERTALITHVVTKGLDPNVSMKDSGVEWLGKIPAHWEATKFAWLIIQSNAGEVIDRGYWHEGDQLLYSCQREPMRSNFDLFPKERRTQAGDLLVTRNGTPYVHLPEPGSIYTNVVQKVRLAPAITTRFAWLALGEAAKSLVGFGDIIESFNMGTWRSLTLPVPPIASQHEIARYVDRETAKIDALVGKVREAIDRLKELRIALISAAVTGKIDVRGEVA